MREPLLVSEVRFTSASSDDIERGLLGWASFTVDGNLRIDGVAVRRTLDGRLVLSFPSRRDGQGRRHAYVRPLDDDARRHVEHQVFEALGLSAEAPR
jgi:DNA-binding cell septation regulator SpoVG